MGESIAIDFGTSKTLVSYWDIGNRSPRLVQLGQLVTQIPSSIFVCNDGSVKIGETADTLLTQDISRYCRGFKMNLGMEGEDALCLWDVEVLGVKRDFTAKDLTAMYLKEIKRICEESAFHGRTISDTIMTVPVAFDEVRRRGLLDAAKEAGLNAKLLDEPIAAGRAYHEMSHGVPYKSALVVDWGGGTLDISLVTNDDGEITCNRRHVFGSCDTGGEMLDKRIGDLVFERCDIPLKPREVLRERIYQQANIRKWKELLATDAGTTCVSLIIESACAYEGKIFKCSLTKKDFEDSIANDLEIIKRTVMRACDVLRTNGCVFDVVLLMGGSSQIPAFAGCVSEATGVVARPWEHSRQAVALGAAYFMMDDFMPALVRTMSSKHDKKVGIPGEYYVGRPKVPTQRAFK